MKAFACVGMVFITAALFSLGGVYEIKSGHVVSNKALLRLEYSGGEAHNRCDIFYTDNLLSSNWAVYSRITFTGVVEELELSSPGFYYLGDGYEDSDGDGLSDSEEKLLYHSDPLSADSDGDGINDYEENKGYNQAGTRVRAGGNGDDWFIVSCEGFDENVTVYWDSQVWVPEGIGKVLIEIIIYSREYSKYTGDQSKYNDRVKYRVTYPAHILEEEYNVNDLHYLFGPGPCIGGNFIQHVWIEVGEDVACDEFWIDLYGEAENIGDGYLGSGVYIKVWRYPFVKMAVDYDHDRDIDALDVSGAGGTNRYYFWVNDDNDRSDISEGDEDVPGGSGWLLGRANCDDDVVNGRCDMADFFPVWLDISAMVRVAGIGDGVRYVLSHEDGGLNGVYTDLSVDEAGDYLTVEEARYGDNLDRRLHEGQVFYVTADGVELSAKFLEKIRDDETKGVILFEGKKKTDKPLVLKVLRGNDVLGKCELGLSIDSVEKMYRWINLRGVAGGGESRATDLSEPANYPDRLCEEKNFVFVHGYSVDEEAARGWNAEMFKRLYWSGSKAKYVAVTWFGNDSQKWWLGDATPDYHVNVIHALDTASALASNLDNDLIGEKIIAGHSLGNMVVSSAIADHGMQISKYMICNGAVAAEAYDGSMTQDVRMVHEWWRDYDERAWSANWYKLFQDRDDTRKKLTWRNCFRRIVTLTDVWNFYSEGDEVFELTEVHGLLTGVFDIKWWFIIPVEWNVDFGRHAWQKQEIFKGTKYQDSLLGIGATKYAGWGFECGMEGPDEEGRYHLVPLYMPEESWELEDDHLRLFPVFRHYPEWLTDMSELSQAQINAMLAKGIPALTPAVGRARVSSIISEKQIDIDYGNDYKPNGWPTAGHVDDYKNRWLHSDIKNVAYYYTYKFFDKVVEEGEMK